MTVQRILTIPDPRLRSATIPVEDVGGGRVMTLIQDLFDTMTALKAQSLSAIQIGQLDQVFVVGDQVFINPTIVNFSADLRSAQEVCCSLPGICLSFRRPKNVVIRATTSTGSQFELEADGAFGRMVQHECDHMIGRLICDHTYHYERPKKSRGLPGY